MQRTGACKPGAHPCSLHVRMCTLSSRPRQAEMNACMCVACAQDATTICAPVAGQLLALASLRHGARYVREKVASLAPNRALLRGALSVLEPECPVHGGGGALYLWAQLPAACGGDDMAAVEWLVKHAGVCVVPGSAFGMPGKAVHRSFVACAEHKCG